MLTCLRIQHLAIVDALELSFEPGLNVITGETGAGKSIVVQALQLVLGERARADIVRTGHGSAEVEALFDIAHDPAFQSRLQHAGFEPSDELLIRRVVQSEGRTRSYVNGRLVTVTQLSELAEGLADISSQHEHHSLLQPAFHIEYLDAYAGNGALRAQMLKAHREVAERQREWDEAQQSARQGLERIDLLRFQIQEIDAAGVRPDALDEDEGLQHERQRLRHVEKIRFAVQATEDALYAREHAIGDELARVATLLAEVAEFDPRLQSHAETLDRVHTEVQEVARDLGHVLRTVEADPERLQAIDDRLDVLQALKRKFGGSLASVLQYRERAATELDRIEHRDDYLRTLAASLDDAAERARDVALKLRKSRVQHAKKLATAISAELQSLGMSHATVSVDVRPSAGSDDTPHGGCSPTGLDRVELLFAPNVGEQPKPLANIASGGELSRTMLAIKRVLGSLGPAGVYVFDEVDTGVGGAVAEVIGRKLQEVSRFHQVICITHLPQIAVYADTHYQARKDVSADRAHSTIERLRGPDHALDEVARMLGGLKITAKTKEAAREMWLEAQRAKQSAATTARTASTFTGARGAR
jgi:DNA repair protein RecN (Recombination protein N)